MHSLGLHGMTRRIYTYLPETGWTHLNVLATIGAFIMGISILMFVINVLISRWHGAAAGANPWDAGTLEWATASPPPHYNFHYLPTVQGSEPVWENRPDAPVISGLKTKKREVLVTTMLDAAPHHRHVMPKDSLWPFFVALSVAEGLLVGGIFHPIGLPIAFGLLAIFLFLWFWPHTDPKKVEHPEQT